MLRNTSGSSFAILLFRPSFTTACHDLRIAEIPVKYLTSADNDIVFLIPSPDTMPTVTAYFAVFCAHNLSNSDCNLCSSSMCLLKTACKNSESIPQWSIFIRLIVGYCRISIPHDETSLLLKIVLRSNILPHQH